MSYEADVHEAQMVILRELLFTNDSTFSKLQKATALESDLFNFHLKKLLANNYVVETKDLYESEHY